jgi:hypothetical protein
MRPLDVAHQYALDYTTPQTIKFYNKGIEKLSGEPFDGTLLFTWLIKVQDKALQYAWIPILTMIFLQKENYTIIKQPQDEPRQDGVCCLKVLIDAYHSNTRSSTTELRRQLAHLDNYMKDVARGDIAELCTHTRSLLYELNAAGETTHDLITKLISAMQKAPDSNFQRWFANQVDLWSMKQRN